MALGGPVAAVALVSARADLVVHLKYDDNLAGNAGAAGATHDGTLNGGAAFTNVAMLGNGAVTFDSALASYVDHGVSPIVGKGDRTVSIWTRNSQVAGDGQRTLISLGESAGAPNGSKMDFDLDASNGGGVGRIEIGVNGGRTAPNYAGPAANDGNWHLVTFTWTTNRGAGMNGGRFLIDGGFVYTPGAASPVIDTAADAFTVGKSVNDAGLFPTVQQYFNGLLDDAAVWNESLTDAEVKGLYDVGVDATLKYDAGRFQQLRAVHNAGSGSVAIGSRTWVYATNLFTTAGLSNIAAGHVLVLNPASRTGVANWNAVPPTVLTQPQSDTNVVGTTATFTTYALGAQPLTYQWYFSNAPVPGANGGTFQRNPVQLTHAGNYFVTASNVNGVSTSAVAVLTVLGNTPPFITANPTNVTVVAGQPFALEAGADGSPTLRYQWRRNGSAVSGATNNPYNVAVSAYPDQGSWAVIVTNTFGAATSGVATVTILDVLPPVISNATNISVAAAGAAGTVVNLAHVTAVDDRDGGVPVTLLPPSGSVFPPGITIVKATAADAGGNSASAFFKVTVLGAAMAQTNLFDNFNVSTHSSNLNFEVAGSTRQSGVLAPVPYSELARNADGGDFNENTQIGNPSFPGALYLNPFNPGAATFSEATLARDFRESASFAVEVDVDPTAGGGTPDWVGIAVGSLYPHVFPDATGDGFGILFRGTNAVSTFVGGAGTLLNNSPVALPTPPYRVRIEVDGTAFGDGSPALIRAFVNGTPLPLSPSSVEIIKTNGFSQNYIVLSGNAQTPGSINHTLDNLAITAVPTIFASHPDLATAVGRSNQTFTVTVPPSVVAVSNISVTLSNANPSAARMVGEAGGALTLNFTAGGTNRQTVTVIGLAAGSTTLTLRNPSVAVAVGGQPVTVQVTGLPLHIANGSFEEAPLPAFPGYGSIAGWNVSDPNWNGVSANLNVGGAIANNQVSGHGRNVAFLQPANDFFAPSQVISTTVSNLTAGRKYQVSFLANNQQNTKENANMFVQVDGVNALASQISTVGNSELGYKPVSLVFTAALSTASLAVSNDSFSLSCLLVDDFRVREVVPGWSVSAWTGDADSGVSNTNTYTHVYNLGSISNVTLNGVLFTGVAGGNPSVSNIFWLGGFPTVLNNNTGANNLMSGASFDLGRDFIYNGQTPKVTLLGLTPGAKYRLSLFGGGFGTTTGTRMCTFFDGTEGLTVDENIFGQGNGLIVNYDYTATSTSVVVDGRALAGGTFHLWAIANQLVAGPSIPTTPTSLGFSVSGGNLSLNWPANYLGWSLQSQTNSLSTGLRTNWATVPGSSLVTSTNFPIGPTSPTVFYRLFYSIP